MGPREETATRGGFALMRAGKVGASRTGLFVVGVRTRGAGLFVARL